ncbi:UNKNOWN [Stylonychia lemnae]|uniref:Uncharacterized protein n=1 Tax=Stylonychia lemnae TaxID=5949 RepID=A0A077ZQ75_STYLE|nr:UNKNOWN [Stylonychia lemnae]|eukprot:CDW72058.1 UNKNOWN [Stylonychia lemnae]
MSSILKVRFSSMISILALIILSSSQIKEASGIQILSYSNPQLFYSAGVANPLLQGSLRLDISLQLIRWNINSWNNTNKDIYVAFNIIYGLNANNDSDQIRCEYQYNHTVTDEFIFYDQTVFASNGTTKNDTIQNIDSFETYLNGIYAEPGRILGNYQIVVQRYYTNNDNQTDVQFNSSIATTQQIRIGIERGYYTSNFTQVIEEQRYFTASTRLMANALYLKTAYIAIAFSALLFLFSS